MSSDRQTRVLVKSLEDHRCSGENAARIDGVDGFLIPVASSNDFEKAKPRHRCGGDGDIGSSNGNIDGVIAGEGEEEEEDYYHICVETDRGDYDFDLVFVRTANGEDVLAETIQKIKIQ